MKQLHGWRVEAANFIGQDGVDLTTDEMKAATAALDDLQEKITAAQTIAGARRAAAPTMATTITGIETITKDLLKAQAPDYAGLLAALAAAPENLPSGTGDSASSKTQEALSGKNGEVEDKLTPQQQLAIIAEKAKALAGQLALQSREPGPEALQKITLCTLKN